jgi:hypothetical protein
MHLIGLRLFSSRGEALLFAKSSTHLPNLIRHHPAISVPTINLGRVQTEK